MNLTTDLICSGLSTFLSSSDWQTHSWSIIFLFFEVSISMNERWHVILLPNDAGNEPLTGKNFSIMSFIVSILARCQHATCTLMAHFPTMNQNSLLWSGQPDGYNWDLFGSFYDNYFQCQKWYLRFLPKHGTAQGMPTTLHCKIALMHLIVLKHLHDLLKMTRICSEIL